jgi:hypothetical protein
MVITMFFITLKDTPHSYIGQANKVPGVKATEDGLEFIAYPPKLADLTEKEHNSLTDVTADQHHAELHAIDSALVHSGVITDTQHGVRTLDNAHAHDDISGVTADQHHTESHHDRHETGGADIVTPTIHHTRHETGGVDEVAGLVFPFVFLDPPGILLAVDALDFDWTDIDISALTGAYTAKAAILCVQTNLTVYVNEAVNKYALTRALFHKKGADIETVWPRHTCCSGVANATNRGYGSACDNFICPVDANEIFQVKLENLGSVNPNVSTIWVWLVGYLI